MNKKRKYELNDSKRQQRNEIKQLETAKNKKKLGLKMKHFAKLNELKAQKANKDVLEDENKKYQDSTVGVDEEFKILMENLAIKHSEQTEDLINKHNQENSLPIVDHREASRQLDKELNDYLIEISRTDSNKQTANQQNEQQQISNKGNV